MDQLAALSASNLAHFTRREALAAGETDQTLQAALRAGVLSRLRFGVYAWTSFLADLDDRGRHLLLARAVVSQQRGRVALAGPTAAVSRGYDVFGHDLSTVHLARLDGGSARRENGVVHHQVGEAVLSEVELHGDLWVVSAADSVWQVALMSSLEGGVVTADSALHGDPGLAVDLAVVAARSRAQPGSRTARLALRLARAGAESVGESLTRMACYRNAIPEPSLQHRVHDGAGVLIGRTDFYWEASRLLGEFDGRIKYGRLLKKDETSEQAVVREKEREDDLRSTACGMSRFVWSEVQPGATARRMGKLRHELEQSRRLYVRVAG